MEGIKIIRETFEIRFKALENLVVNRTVYPVNYWSSKSHARSQTNSYK